MANALYVVFGLAALACFEAAGWALGVRFAVWTCLLLLPLRIILPPEIGGLIGFENLFLVPDLLIPLTFLVWLAKRTINPPPADHPAARARLLPRALLFVFVAFLLSFRPGESLRDYASEFQKWIVYTMAFVVVSQSVRTPRDLAQAVSVLLLGGMLATLRDVPEYFGIFKLPAPFGYQANQDAELFSVFSRFRYQGTGGPQYIIVLLLLIFPYLVVLGPSLSRFKRWIIAVYAGVLLFLLALTFYRGDWAAFALGLAAMLLFPGLLSRRTVRYAVTATAVGSVVVILALGGGFTSALQDRFLTLLRPGSERHVVLRIDAMSEAWEMFREHPITGIGAGQYGPNFETYERAQLYGEAWDPAFFQQANNDYFQYLATIGLVGFASLVVLFGSFLAWSRRMAMMPDTDPRTRAVLIGCFLSIVGILGDALTEDPMWDKVTGTLVFTLFAFIWGAGLAWTQAPEPDAMVRHPHVVRQPG